MKSTSLAETERLAEEFAGQAGKLAAEAFRYLDDSRLAGVPDQAVQQLLAVAVRLFAAKRQANPELPAFTDESVTATDVSIVTTAMLDAVDLELFELSLWRGWGSA